MYVNCWHENHCELIIEGECSKLHPEELEAKAESLLRGSSSKEVILTTDNDNINTNTNTTNTGITKKDKHYQREREREIQTNTTKT